jgi:hypothetical protein
MPTDDEVRAMIERLVESTIDWNGERMVDGEPPRRDIYCKELREAAIMLRQLLDEREKAADAIVGVVEVVIDKMKADTQAWRPLPKPEA